VRACEFLGKLERVLRRGKAIRPRSDPSLAERAVAALLGRSGTAKWMLLRLRGLRAPTRP
jgi:hypothetical protein